MIGVTSGITLAVHPAYVAPAASAWYRGQEGHTFKYKAVCWGIQTSSDRIVPVQPTLMLQSAAQAHQGAKATLGMAKSRGAKEHRQQVNMQSFKISSSDNLATHDKHVLL